MCQSKNFSTLEHKIRCKSSISNIKEHTCVRFNSKTLSKCRLARLAPVLDIFSGLSDALGSLITIQRKKKKTKFESSNKMKSKLFTSLS